MKIGILTFHHSRNYGAVLQAYALKEVLVGFGHKVEVIDYRNPSMEAKKTPFSLGNFCKNPLKYLFRLFNIYAGHRRKVCNFSRFEKEQLNVTLCRYYPEDIRTSDYDIIVIGSDQVWSPIITNGPDQVFWGNYCPSKAKLITYAASSCSLDLLETKDFNSVEEWLSRFNTLSVREKRLKSYIETHSNKTAHVVLDPTLLAGRSVFEKITPKRVVKEPYVLFYQVEKSKNAKEIASKVAELYHAKLIGIGVTPFSNMIRKSEKGIRIINASVYEILSLVKYAECVVAYSFHGTALSLIYEKNFFSVRGNNIERVEAVLSKCNLMNRVVQTPGDIEICDVDYKTANAHLSEMRRNSLNWLRQAITD